MRMNSILKYSVIGMWFVLMMLTLCYTALVNSSQVRNSGVYSGEFAAKIHSVVLLVAPGGGGEGRTGGERQMKRWPKDVML